MPKINITAHRSQWQKIACCPPPLGVSVSCEEPTKREPHTELQITVTAIETTDTAALHEFHAQLKTLGLEIVPPHRW